MFAREIYEVLCKIKFNSDDKKNPHTWLTVDHINGYMNQAVNDNGIGIAYYIGPTNFAYNCEDAIRDFATHVCPRSNGADSPLNDHYSVQKGLDKPFVFIANTQTVLAENPTDTNKEGGTHWVSWVLLPKKFRTLSGEEKNHDKYQLFFFDSLGSHSFPVELKKALEKGFQFTQDKTSITLLPFCKANQITIRDCGDLTGHQNGMNGSDCGWWAIYYAIMTIYTGGLTFLEPIKSKKLSGIPLREVICLSASRQDGQDKPKDVSEKPKSKSSTSLVTTPPAEPISDASHLMGEGEYPASGLKLAFHGNIYQLKLLMLFVWRGLKNKYSFRLATEMNQAEKFDDVVFRYTISKGVDKKRQVRYRFLQAKHKQDESKKITINDLLTQNDDDFSLQKYFISYRRIKKVFTDGTIRDLIICTNINFDFAGDANKIDAESMTFTGAFTEIKDKDNILQTSGSEKSKRYRFNADFPGKKQQLYPVLRQTSDMTRLARRLAFCIVNNKDLNLKDDLFKQYHGPLAKEVIDTKKHTLHEEFLKNNSGLSPAAKKFREELEVAILAEIEKAKDSKIDENDIYSSLSERTITTSKSFGHVFELKPDLKLTNPKELADAIFSLIKLKGDSKSSIKIQRKSTIISDNIDNLAGHVLVMRDGKMCFSTAFLSGKLLPDNLNKFREELQKKCTREITFDSLDGYHFDITNYKTCEEDQLHTRHDLPDDVITDDEIDEFLRHVVFAVGQVNEVKLDKSYQDEIGDALNLIDSDFVTSQFQKEMLDWMKAKEGRFITSTRAGNFFVTARQKIARLVLIGPTLEYQSRIKKSGIVFIKTLSLNDFLISTHQVLHIIAPQTTWLSSIALYQALGALSDYQKDDSYISVRLDSAVHLQFQLINAFKTHHLLVIECNCQITDVQVQSLLSELLSILSQNPKKKIVIISTDNHSYASLFKKSPSYREIKDDIADIGHLDGNSQSLIKQKRIQFLGKETTLGQLVPDTMLSKVVDAEVLMELVSSESILVSEDALCLTEFESACYIDRTLTQTRVVRKDCFVKNTSDVFVVSNITEAQLQPCLPPDAVIRISSNEEKDKKNPARFIILSGENEEKQYKILLKQLRSRSVHWLRKDDETFIWVRSRGALSGFRDHIDCDSVSESNPLDVVSTTILAAEPGMGKSTLVTRMYEEFRKRDASQWIVFITLKEHSELLSKTNFTRLDDVIDFISYVKKLTPLGKSLLRYYLETPDKTILFIDGFDELYRENQIKIIQLVKLLRLHSKVKTVVVTTRLHLGRDLEDTLSSMAYSLKPFLQKDIEDYLEKYWVNSLGLDEIKLDRKRIARYITVLFNCFSAAINDKKNAFMGIPLQARMLAEAYQDDFATFYDSKQNKPVLPDNIDVLSLYKRFIQQKYNIYFKEKLRLDDRYNRTINIQSVMIQGISKVHQHHAFSELFPEDATAFLDVSAKSFITIPELVRIGIIQVINNKPSFIHRTFAEYFVADLLFSRLCKSVDNKKYIKTRQFLIQHIFKDRNNVIRIFLERKILESNDTQLKERWGSITACVLVNGITEGESGVSILQAADKDEIEPEAESDESSFNDLTVKLKNHHGRIDFSKTSAFLSAYFKKALEVSDSDALHKALTELAALAEATTLNKLKTLVLENIDDIIKHYIEQLFAQTGNVRIEIDYKLLRRFSAINPDMGAVRFSLYAEMAAADAKSAIKSYLNQLKVYIDLQALVNKPPKALDEIITTLSEVNILYLRIINARINLPGLKQLMNEYERWKRNSNFLELFLNVNEGDAERVKQFLIKKEEWTYLVKLLIKFPPLRLDINDIKKIYSGKSLFWLERSGIFISRNLSLLTPQMAVYFNSILDEEHIDGTHHVYAAKIVNELIEFLLEQKCVGNLSSNIDDFALLSMTAHFIHFSVVHTAYVSFTPTEFNALFKLAETVLNRRVLSGNLLANCVESLIMLINAAQLKLIDTGDTLLVINPRSDFQYKFELVHKNEITKLINYKIKNADNFVDECTKTAGQLSLSARPLVNLGFHSPGMNSGQQVHLIKRSVSLNDLRI